MTAPRHPLALLADYLEQVQRLDAIDEADLPITPEIMAPLVEAHSAVLSLDPAALRAQAEAEAGLRAALVHYAELRHYDHAGRLWSGDPDEHEDAQVDFGEIARAALAQAGGDGQ